MEKKKIILLIGLFLILLFVGFILFKPSTKETVPANNNQNKINIKKKIDTSTWNEYINNQLGFSIKIPSEVFMSGSCEGDKYDSLKILQDNENNSVYILTNHYTIDNGKCLKVSYSLDDIRKQKQDMAGEIYFSPYLGWNIMVNNIANKEDILKYLKSSFGSGCFIDNEYLREDGSYRIYLKGTRNSESDPWWGTCPLNFSYRIIYSPEKHKLMSVVLGQECKFQSIDPELSDQSYQCYDEEMIKTFKFE